MLATARRSIAQSRLEGRIAIAQADATLLDPQALFGVATFDRIFISYALSMIPAWKEALARACDCLDAGRLAAHRRFRRPGRASRAVPAWRSRAGWRCSPSIPCLTLEAELTQFAAARDMRCRFGARFRGYAFLAALETGAAG